MSKIHKPGDQYEILPGGCPDHVRLRHYREGECIGTGFAQHGAGAFEPGKECIDLGPPNEKGLRSVRSHFTINSEGSVCRSKATTPEYLDGWDRIFAARRKPSTQTN